MIELWYSPGACSLAPHVLLYEVGLPFTARPVALATGEQLTEGFARLNAKQQVPVLSMDGAVITENPAIMAAIAGLAPEQALLGASDIERARAYEWMAWLSGTLHGQGFGALWRPARFSDVQDHHPSIRAKGRATIAAAFDFIEGSLNGTHAVGGAFSAVDAFLLVFYRWGNGIGLPMAGAYPRYAALAESVVGRQAARAALAAEGIDADPLRDRVPGQAA